MRERSHEFGAGSVTAVLVSDLDETFAMMAREGCDALVVLSDPRCTGRIPELAAKGRLPAIYQLSEFARFGGLMGYGPNLEDRCCSRAPTRSSSRYETREITAVIEALRALKGARARPKIGAGDSDIGPLDLLRRATRHFLDDVVANDLRTEGKRMRRRGFISLLAAAGEMQ